MVEGNELFVQLASTVEPGRDQDGVIIGDGDGTAVQGQVVDGAAGEAVVHRFGAASLHPADVGGLQSEVDGIELHLKATEGALVTPDGQDVAAEGGIATGGAGGAAEVEDGGGEDASME